MFSPDTIRTLAALGFALDDIAEPDPADGSEHQRRRGARDGGRRDGSVRTDADESDRARR